MKILIVKRDKLGDLLLSTPMIAHLRASLPYAEIHLLANNYNSWVVDGNLDIDHRWVYERVREGGRLRFSAAVRSLLQTYALRRQRFDWVIVANGEDSPRGISRGLSVRGRRTVAYCTDPKRYPSLTDPLEVQSGMHEIDRMLAMLSPLGVNPPSSDLWPKFLFPGESTSFAKDWLASRRIKDYVVIGLGSRRAKKQPSSAQILRWSSHLKTSFGLDTVFVWTPGVPDDPRYPGDDLIAQPVLDANLSHIHPFRGPLRQALGLVWSARTSVFPDSGLMHFAAASRGGVLGFFADSAASPSPTNWAPRGPRAFFLEANRTVAELSDDQVLPVIDHLITSYSAPN
jgi:ADP-heptose:LPS heptosyltransferase